MGNLSIKKHDTTPVAQGYVGLNGNVTNYAGRNILGTSVEAGGRVDIAGAFMDLKGSVGTNYGVDANVGYKFDFKKDMGLELSAGASMQGEFAKLEATQNLDITNGDTSVKLSQRAESGLGDYRLKAGVKYTYEPSWGKVKVGLEGGYRAAYGDLNYANPTIVDGSTGNTCVINPDDKNLSQKISNMNLNSCYMKPGSIYQNNVSGAYVTPTIEAEAYLGKKGLSAFGEADMYSGKVGLRYTFGKNK